MHPFQAVSDPLAMPVGALAAHTDPIQKGSSVRAAALALAESGVHAIAVAEGPRLIGIVDEPVLLSALARGLDTNNPVEDVMDPNPLVLPPHATGAEALRLFSETGRHAIAVVDVMGNAVGVLTPSRLFHPPRVTYRPQAVGGLATPFGVYLTNGTVSGGAQGFALVAAGTLLFGLFFVAMFAVLGLAHAFGLDVRDLTVQGWMNAATSLLFLAGIRLIPLAGTHGAEHMVVHAIERGEDLVPEVVRRMPRVHPRCGTNIAVGAMLFLGLFTWEWSEHADLRLLGAMLATLFLWRPLGSFVQYYFTTRPPNDRQLMSGIRAGRELLAASMVAPRSTGGFFRKLASSGIIHVVFGATLAQVVVYFVLELLRLPDTWRVLF
jgi:hypothetical protein